MTEHYTKQEAVELARECGELLIGGLHTLGGRELHALVNTAATRKLAEKELEVVRLREALESCMVNSSDGNQCYDQWLVEAALSTPSSTKHLDEYVAGKVKEALDNGPYGEEVNDILSSKLATAEKRVKELEIGHEWKPIASAPKDNKRRLLLARFNDDGSIQSFDWNGGWESESESWEIPHVYHYWASENGNVEEPSHWMYEPDWLMHIDAAIERSE